MCGIGLFLSCHHVSRTDTTNNQPDSLHMDTAYFKGRIEGEDVRLLVLKNDKGSQAYITNFGARIVGLWIEDKQGNPRDVILGFTQAKAYHNVKEPYFGAIVGPFGNRIAKGLLTIDSTTYHLPVNNGMNTLHGGLKGVHFVTWKVLHVTDSTVKFEYMHPDAQDGFPGNIRMEVTYSLNDRNELQIDYQASSDKKTVINLTNHAYFNLNGEGSGTILNHRLQLWADYFTPVDSTLIPTGKLEAVRGTPFDFTTSKAIGKDIDVSSQQLAFGHGYDHNFVLRKDGDGEFFRAARVVGDESGIVMEILTKEPGLQFYSGNFMNEQVVLKNRTRDSFRTGFCLEPQHFPDSPNHRHFPSTVLMPNTTYETSSIYRFSIDK